MIPIKQTKLHIENKVRGNCMSACFASYLEIDINDVPAFEEMEDWHSDLFHWLHELNYEIETSYTDPFINEGFKDFYFAAGISPRNKNIQHLVIYKEGKLVHDPHPDNTGLVGNPISYWYLIENKDL